MHVPVRLGLLTLGTALPLAAQTAPSPAAPVSCPVTARSSASARAVSLRSQLRREAVPAEDPSVPVRVDGLLAQFKDALAATARAAFTCAKADATTDQLQTTLAEALQANRAIAADTGYETRAHRDVGTYGADLSVQVLQLFGTPKIFEVDFRYTLECGDDHLLLIFETPSADKGDPWRETLRWQAPHYATVGDALGDFVLLTPLTGSYQHPVWRYLVAHGQPGCGDTPRPSHFALDLLTPTADPAKPLVTWHFAGAYSEGTTVPRLATTENTIDFRLEPAPPAVAAPSDTSKKDAPASPPPPPQVFQFQLDGSGNIVPVPPRADPAS